MAISEQLDLISKEIGGKLDDNGSIEQQVQEIYNIIKSGAWPASGGGSEPYTLPTAGDDVKGGVKVPSGGFLKMEGENLSLRYTSYSLGAGFIGSYDGYGSLQPNEGYQFTGDYWVKIKVKGSSSIVTPVQFSIQMDREGYGEYEDVIEDVTPTDISHWNKTYMLPVREGQYLKFTYDGSPSNIDVEFRRFAMDYSNTSFG